MGRLRRTILTALPKVLISRSTRLLVNLPLPRFLRAPIYGTFARAYGADLDEAAQDLRDFRSMAAFFQRELKPGARPISDTAPFVWPADGKVVQTGPIDGDRMPQIKGIDYALADLLGDPQLAKQLTGGSQATVYLAPGDYHRVHAPFDAQVLAQHHIPGGLFPVNAGAVHSIPGLFARNERVVFPCDLPDGRKAAIVMVAALNVSDTSVANQGPHKIAKGDLVGSFGLGSTAVVIVGPGEPALPTVPPETVVRMGRPITAPQP